MAENDVEIELKFPLKNPKDVEKFLNENAKIVSKNVSQTDTYFCPPHRDFMNEKHPFEWLRLRETTENNSLNYKHYHPEGAKKKEYCDEFESRLERPDAVKKILDVLDFRELVKVKKTRSTWLLDDAEISIDNVTGLGTFIEIEALNHLENPGKTKEPLYAILEKIGVKAGKEDFMGYPRILLEKQDA